MDPAEVHVARAPAGCSRWCSFVAIAALPLIVAVIYGRALFAPFFFDDANTVLLNPTIQTPSSVRIVLAGNRPVLNLTFAGTFRLSGRAPWGHRLLNLVLHAVNALLLFLWLRLTLRALGGSALARAWLPWIAALFFVVHPLQVEAVTYISGRADVLVTFFSLLALLGMAAAYVHRARPWLASTLGAATVLATLAAAASKESAVVVPLVLIGYAALLHGGLGLALRAHWRMFTGLTAPWVLTALLLARHPQAAQTAGLAFGSSEYGISPLHYLYTQAGVIVRYFRLAVLPYGQVFDYDWPVVDRPSAALVPALLLVGCALAALWAGRRSLLYPFAMAWIFATLAPTSSIIPIADVIAERRMYMPLVGVALLVALISADAIEALRRRQRPSRWVSVPCVLVLLVFAALAWTRNGLWNDPLRLWQDTVRKQPGNPRAHTNLGIRYLQRGNVNDARIELEAALDLVAAEESAHATPRHGAFAATHLAVAYLELGDPVAAREAYAVARELGAETYRELREPLQRVLHTLATLGQGDPDSD